MNENWSMFMKQIHFNMYTCKSWKCFDKRTVHKNIFKCKRKKHEIDQDLKSLAIYKAIDSVSATI